MPNGFKVLEYNQMLMVRLGLSSRRLFESTNEFYKSFMPYFNITFLTINIILSGLEVLKHWPDLNLLMEPVTIIVAAIQGGAMILSVGLNMKLVKKLFISLQDIVDNEGDQFNYFHKKN